MTVLGKGGHGFGGGGGRSCDEIRLAIQQQGQKVTAIDMPGTRANERAVAKVTMDMQTVADVIKEKGHKVTLIGHSLAGAVISQVAEFLPEKIERLIYVAGFVLKSGDSVIEAMQRDPDEPKSAKSTQRTFAARGIDDYICVN